MANQAFRGDVMALAALVFGAPALPAAPAPDPPHAPAARSRVAPLKPAEFDNALTIGGDDIAAKKVNTRMTVAVQVEGRGPYRFVVDSGADTSVVGARIARTLNLAPAEPVMLHGMTESSQVQRVRVNELGIGNSTFRDLKLPVLREYDLGGDGMIGIDALVAQRLMMDFDKKVITVEDARRPAPRFDGEIVVTARRRRGQLILTRAAVDRHAIEAVIDTGSEITIGNSALRRQLGRRYGGRVAIAEMTGVTGVVVKVELIVVDELKVGPVVLRSVPVAFADVPPFKVFGLDQQPALLLGTDMMATFRRVSLDFKARKVRFQLRRCAGSGVIINTSPMLQPLSRIQWRDPGGMACV